MADAAQLTGTIAGAVIAFAGGAFTTWLAGRRDSARFKREKWWKLYDDRRTEIERVYLVFEEFRAAYNDVFLAEITALRDGRMGKLPDFTVPWSKMKMLVGLYAPELQSRADEVERRGLALGGVIAQNFDGFDSNGLLKATHQGAWQRQRTEAAMEAIGQLSDSVERALSDLTTIAQRLRSDASAMTNEQFTVIHTRDK